MAVVDDSQGAAIEAILQATALFRSGEAGLVAKIARSTPAEEVTAGATLVRAGSPGDSLGILLRGRASLSIVNAATGTARMIESLQVGDHFGEVAILTGGPQPFSVTADEACTVFRLRPDMCEALLARLPGFGTALGRRLATRSTQLAMMAGRAGGATNTMVPTQAPVIDPRSLASDVIAFVETGTFEIGPRLLGMLPATLMVQHRIIPLRLRAQVLTVGMVAPRNVGALSALKRVLQNVEIEVMAIGLEDFADACARLRITAGNTADNARGGRAATHPDTLTFDQSDSERELDKAVRVVGDEVVRVFNRIVAAALDRDASDIHIEPEASAVRVRFRAGGVLTDWSEMVPAGFAKGIASRVKVLAGLDITERRLPQDGRIGLTAGRREVDLRVSTLPSNRGEKVVLRVLEASGLMRPLDKVFLDPNVLNVARRSLGRPFGAVIIAGPTGSGKSSTLYSLLNERKRARPDSSITMVEDPTEYRLQGITQVQVNPVAGLNFPQVLRGMLRQDPDVIAVGEVRDGETASIALEAAMTGHLLFSSMHGNDAFALIERLEDLGCRRSVVAQSLALVLVQRLARKLCANCCRLDSPPTVLLDSLIERRLVDPSAGAVMVPRSTGCEVCNQTGYSGRVAVVEALNVTDDVRNGLMADQALADIRKAAIQSRALSTFAQGAAFLLAQNLIGASEALLTVSE